MTSAIGTGTADASEQQRQQEEKKDKDDSEDDDSSDDSTSFDASLGLVNTSPMSNVQEVNDPITSGGAGVE
jgi:hypothetical protein